MTQPLLPIGCYDTLYPLARLQSQLAMGLLNTFESFGYQQIAPSLLEYSDNLLSGRGGELSSQIFRVMDNNTQHVMAVRPDITLQIGRLVNSRLKQAALPLRVCYNGLILKNSNQQYQTGCQLRQAGIELVGAHSAQADSEVIRVAVTALRQAGIKSLSVDLNLPGLVAAMLEEENLTPADQAKLLAAIAHKDISALSTFNLSCKDTLTTLIQSAGSAQTALAALSSCQLPQKAAAQIAYLKQVIALIEGYNLPGCTITVDITEIRGAAYHDGISFSVFVSGIANEVGSGGHYHIETDDGPVSATGFTLYVETLTQQLAPQTPKRVFVPIKADETAIEALRKDGYATIYALESQPFTNDEAVRTGCNFIWQDNTIKDVT